MRLSLTLLFLQLWNNVQVSLSQNACQKLPLVLHAHISDDTEKVQYQAGDEINFICETGYISGPTIRYMCTNTGWATLRQGTCYLKPCPLPDETPNGFYQIIHGIDLVFGTTIQYFCNSGYYMVSKEDTRTCLLAGWTNHVPICEHLTCELPPADEGMTVEGLQMNDEPIPPDRFLRFSCTLPGQHLNGEAVLLCGKDGKWNHPFPTCEEISCTVGDMHPNLTATEVGPVDKKVKVGQKLTFKCDEGYTLDRSGEVQCLETGQWSAPFPTCNNKCIIKGIPSNVNIRNYNEGDQLSPGQKVQLSCRIRSHVVQGKSEIHCLANGQWSHPFPTCGAPLGCEQPPGVDNAEIMGSLKASYAHGEVVKYICPEYYLLEGQNFKKCENSIWTGKVGCLTPCTVNRGAMNNHNIRFKYRRDDKLYSTHNDFIEFVCSKGRPSGNTGMRVQCNNGVIILPTCQ